MISLENTKCNLPNRRRAIKWFIASGVYFTFLSILSHIPGETIASVGFSIWDKAAHFGVYAFLGVLLGIALKHHLGKSGLMSILIATFAVGILGAVDEMHQIFVPGRTASIDDWIADGLGGFFGALVVFIYPLAVLNHLRISNPMNRNSES